MFTRRVEAFLSSDAGWQQLFHGKPALAVRWEQWEGSWPDDFQAALAEKLIAGDHGVQDGEQARKLVELALSEGRVVLIMDALDQVNENTRITRLSDFLTKSKQCTWPVRVLMTGRPFAIEQRRSTLLDDNRWQFICIEDFDAEQQYRYLRGDGEAPPAKSTKSKKSQTRDSQIGNSATNPIRASKNSANPLVEAIELSASDARNAEKRLKACKENLGKRFANYD
ncbi:MAG: hypothetical protein ACKPEY_02635, partial [Planctomycetota bacterium]